VTRTIDIVSADDPRAVLRALRAALTGAGPALLPRAVTAVGPGRTAARTATRTTPALPSTAPELPRDVPQRVALVIETSGSTGIPKRVALSADALLASAAASAGALGGPDGFAQWLLCLPAHYIAGANVLIRSITAGTEPVIMPPEHFDPSVFRDAADAMTGDARFVSLVPVQVDRLMDAAATDAALLAALRRFDGILVGGQSMPVRLRERAAELGLRIVRTYGSSETSGGCVYDGAPIGTVRARAVGGALELAGPVLAEGYLDDDARTNAAFHYADGVRWYRTGDLGRVDDDGRVTVLGRADNVIISGGEKVLLDAVERRVRELPGFEAAVVVGADDHEWGQVPVVIVPGEASTTLRDLRAHVADALGRAAAPARVLEVPTVPHLRSGKPDRVALARLAAAAPSCR
jgi:Acyl-CoA synthetases (AMP-forming)/AMP-acid ligases II